MHLIIDGLSDEAVREPEEARLPPRRAALHAVRAALYFCSTLWVVPAPYYCLFRRFVHFRTTWWTALHYCRGSV